MRGYQIKNISGGILDVDKGSRSVKVAVSQMGSKDRDQQIIDPKAWNRTIREAGPAGINEVWHLLDHTAKFASSLGKPKEVSVVDDKLVFLTSYKDTFAWREVAWPHYEAGDITQHSVGFTALNSVWEKHNGENVEVLTELKLWEGSAVLWGANANTPTLEVAKSLGIYKDDDEPGKRIECMFKALKSDKFDDEAKELFRIELQQLYQQFDDLKKATSPGGKPTNPELDVARILLAL